MVEMTRSVMTSNQVILCQLELYGNKEHQEARVHVLGLLGSMFRYIHAEGPKLKMICRY